jgi:hypothetical protein
MISIETAKQILEALGPASITTQAVSPAELAADFEEFQVGRSNKNPYGDWLAAILATERIHLETDGATSVADRDEQLDQMRRRIYAVKVKGDEMKKAKKNSTTKKPAAQLKSVGKKRTVKPQAQPAETTQPVATASAAPKVGDLNLATEADFTSPAHPRLSDYRYYAMVDNKNRIVGRGFLARVDKDPRRTWFALRNEEQTTLWETSKWAIREIAFERYQELTLEYLQAEGWPEFKSTRAKEAAAA